jgi:hypothetical protein
MAGGQARRPLTRLSRRRRAGVNGRHEPLLGAGCACADVLPTGPGSLWKDPSPHVPATTRKGGTRQQVSLSGLPSYEQVIRQLRSIEASSHGAVAVASAGLCGGGRQLLYATLGHGPSSGCRPGSTATNCTALKYLGSSGSPEAQRIRDALTVVVIPMYNPDGATANIRQSTTPFRIDLNRDWENFQQPESRAFYALWEQLQPRLALDLHHFGQASRVQGTRELNAFQIGARSMTRAG